MSADPSSSSPSSKPSVAPSDSQSSVKPSSRSKNFPSSALSNSSSSSTSSSISSTMSIPSTISTSVTPPLLLPQKWIKLSPKEMEPYIHNPCHRGHHQSSLSLQHCCIGQCQQSQNQRNPIDVLYKYNIEYYNNNQPLAKLSHVLDHLQRVKDTTTTTSISRNQNSTLVVDDDTNIVSSSKSSSSTTTTTHRTSSCKMSFYGDSLQIALFMAMTCELRALGYKETSCNLTDIAIDVFGDDMKIQCQRNDELKSTIHFVFEKEDDDDVDSSSSCQKVVIAFVRPINKPPWTTLEEVDTSMKELAEYATNKEKGGGQGEGFVHIYNWGVHCKGRNVKCLWNHVEETLLPYATSDQYQNWTFLYNEHDPQHFNLPGGGYDPKLFENPESDKKCTAIKDDDKADNWRNEEVVKILDYYNLTERVKIIPQFDDLVPLWQLHFGFDCTHYCYNPLRYDLTWDRLLKTLKQV